jgi:hypothetical protein
VLVCVVLSTTLVPFAVLRCIRASKRDIPAIKSNYYVNRPKVTNYEVEEAYYATVRSKHDDSPEGTKETEEAYITMKSICDDKPEATKEIEEAYYTTAAVRSKHDDKPEATKETEEAYITI